MTEISNIDRVMKLNTLLKMFDIDCFVTYYDDEIQPRMPWIKRSHGGIEEGLTVNSVDEAEEYVHNLINDREQPSALMAGLRYKIAEDTGGEAE
jgi:hypothetical protein